MGTDAEVPGCIGHMRVSIWPIRAGGWGYLAGSWGEDTPHFIFIFMNIRGNEK